MKCEDVLACSLPEWYPKFSKSTFKSVILPLPQDVLTWLRSSETLRLPRECNDDNPKPQEQDDGEDSWDEEEEEEGEAPHFPEFSSKIQEAMSKLGGKGRGLYRSFHLL